MAYISKVHVGSQTYDIKDSGIREVVEQLPTAMQFKGTLGTDGTISVLPAASSANEGWAYKVITAGTYQSVAVNVGDLIVSNANEWVVIPRSTESNLITTSVTLSANSWTSSMQAVSVTVDGDTVDPSDYSAVWSSPYVDATEDHVLACMASGIYLHDITNAQLNFKCLREPSTDIKMTIVLGL